MITPMAYERDPVSVLLDRGARELLERVYKAPRGTWVMTRLADPPERTRAWARARYGIDVDGPDNAPTLSGKRANAHTRWGRAFMRALWYQHRQYGPTAGPTAGRGARRVRTERRVSPTGTPLEVSWGRRVPALGVIPAGRAVRVRVPYGGKTARRVVEAKARDDRIWVGDREQGGRFSVAAERDWG